MYTILIFFICCRSPVTWLGIETIEAIHYAVDTINRDPNILPSVKLGFDIYSVNLCANTPDEMYKNLHKLVNRRAGPIVGVVGPHTSKATRFFFSRPEHNMVSVYHSVVALIMVPAYNPDLTVMIV